jgi:alpha-glucan, water dikinase
MEQEIALQSGHTLTVNRQVLDDAIEISIALQSEQDCLLHWGLCRNHSRSWEAPPLSLWPPGSRAYGRSAIQTSFAEQQAPGRIVIGLDQKSDYSFMEFALYFPQNNRWDSKSGQNYRIEIGGSQSSECYAAEFQQLGGMADAIIQNETSRNSWTLMHRFNLCYDLLDQAHNNAEAKALIFVWLRYSSLRQLDWQRNYNTKPRELGHALERLTLKLAGLYQSEPDDREMIRLILTTLGRGADAQRVRDEVLHIMHRRHIKEVSGHFMEEWHQKLHNNTTADDIVICEAYLGFLRSDGDLSRFYQRLEKDGVTRERLEGYERPIRSHPDFIPYLKNDLIYDFEHFLGILKDVHAGTDLGIAMQAARYLCDEPLHQALNYIWDRRNNPETSAAELAAKITEARGRIKDRIPSGSAGHARDLLFLDLALENELRAIMEARLGSHMDFDATGTLLGRVMENLLLSNRDMELEDSLKAWTRLSGERNAQEEWALKAKSVLDRLSRLLGSFIDRYHRLLQPKAESLGLAFHADAWTIRLFTEEVIRGRLEFALSMLLRYFDPMLRKKAKLGNWQVISRGGGIGRVQAAPQLKSLQHESFDRPTILVADAVSGDEEIPEGVIAVFTPDATDVVSHVAIRARNARLLFATCYDAAIIEKLKTFDGTLIKAALDAAGEVFFEPAHEIEAGRKTAPKQSQTIFLRSRSFTSFAVSAREFTEETVGGKSIHLTRLEGKLPQWIGLPVSVALPFGVFEKVLGETINREIADRYSTLLTSLGHATGREIEKALAALRATVLEMAAPDELVSSLSKAMKAQKLPWPENWESVWMCIKRVWGSKWNERAFFSRRAMNLSHQDLFMAVLIQEVVEAEYSFVIHTANPVTGDKNEIYAEVVRGLGEALVANYAGRALSFSCNKETGEFRLLSFPSKSVGVFGGGLIFRSDSNGEDLAGYAGAGLYDSIMLPDPRKISLNYIEEPLFWDGRFRSDLLASISEIGREVEKAMGSPQDIEGACSKNRYFVVQSRPQVGLD